MKRDIRVHPIFLAGAWLAAGVMPAHAAPPDEAAPRITAAVVVNFVKYTQWPQSAFDEPDDPIVISVVAAPRMARLLTQLVCNKPLHGRDVVIQHTPPPEPNEEGDVDEEEQRAFRKRLRASHVVFIGSDYQQAATRVLTAMDGADALTIGCFPGFARQGGMLNIRIHDERARLEANPEAIGRTNVSISSHVLRLAELVKDQQDE